VVSPWLRERTVNDRRRQLYQPIMRPYRCLSGNQRPASGHSQQSGRVHSHVSGCSPAGCSLTCPLITEDSPLLRPPQAILGHRPERWCRSYRRCLPESSRNCFDSVATSVWQGEPQSTPLASPAVTRRAGLTCSTNHPSPTIPKAATLPRQRTALPSAFARRIRRVSPALPVRVSDPHVKRPAGSRYIGETNDDYLHNQPPPQQPGPTPPRHRRDDRRDPRLARRPLYRPAEGPGAGHFRGYASNHHQERRRALQTTVPRTPHGCRSVITAPASHTACCLSDVGGHSPQTSTASEAEAGVWATGTPDLCVNRPTIPALTRVHCRDVMWTALLLWALAHWASATNVPVDIPRSRAAE
jgi:hypothetical protein